VAKIAFVDQRCITCPLYSLVVEKAHPIGAMVLWDERTHTSGQPVMPRQFETIFDVVNDDLGTGLWIKTIVWIHAFGLILCEKVRAGYLAHIVVVGPHAGKQRIGTDPLGGLLRQIGDHQAMMIRSWSFAQEPLQERVIGTAELDEPHRRGNVEQRTDEKESTQCQTGREATVDHAAQTRDQQIGRLGEPLWQTKDTNNGHVRQ